MSLKRTVFRDSHEIESAGFLRDYVIIRLSMAGGKEHLSVSDSELLQRAKTIVDSRGSRSRRTIMK
jgi:hypothetical protein